MAPINPDDDNKLAPDIILGARQFPNPEGIAPRMDTEGPPPTRFTGGAKLTLADNPGGLGVSGTAAPQRMTSPTSLEDAAAAANEQEDTEVDQPQEQGINKLGSHYPSMPKPAAAAGSATEASPELGLPAVSGSGPAIAHQATMADVPAPVNNPEGQARHAEQLRQFGAAKEKLNSQLLRSPDEFSNPLEYSRHLESVREGLGAIKEAKAEYELSHPWGSMESAHPGFFGKLGHAFGTIGNVAGEALAPGVAAAIPGSHERLLQQKAAGEQEIGTAVKEQSESAAAGLAGQKAITEATKPEVNEARTDELKAKQGLEEKKTDIAAPKDESQAIHDLMVGNPEGGPRINPLTQKPYTYAEAYGAVKGLAKPQSNKPPNWKQMYQDALNKGDAEGAKDVLKMERDWSAASQPPQRPPQELVAVPNDKGGATAQVIHPGSDIAPNTKTVKDLTKGASVDETRRADLARNMNENLDQLEDIVTRRPDLFGPFAGRMTQLKSAIGTNDQDIAKANAIKEFMGMAAVGTHAMRNAGHVEAAANAIVNAYKNGPDAIKAAIDEGRRSTATFQQDAGEQPGAAPKNAPKGGSKEIHYKVVNGQLVKQ